MSYFLDSYEKWKRKVLEILVIENTEKESERISKINGNDDYKCFLKDKENITQTNHPDDCDKAVGICENIKEVLQLFIETSFFCHKLCEEDKRQAEIDKLFDLSKQHQSSESDYEIDSVENQNKWNFYIITVDGVQFTIPFEDGKVTLGSKLISNSLVFERMLENPMREKNEKIVKLNDTDCGTFINFLQYLRTKEIKAETLAELCNCYEFADQYDVPEMLSLCIERMPSFLSLSNREEIEELAHLHADNNLTKLVESFNEACFWPVSGLNECRDIFSEEKSLALILETNDKETYFEFYQ